MPRIGRAALLTTEIPLLRTDRRLHARKPAESRQTGVFAGKNKGFSMISQAPISDRSGAALRGS
jgi:hypothetical protein